MKPELFRLARHAACLAMGLGFLASGNLRAQITTILDCPDGLSGDLYTRGFYVPSYPGTSMNGVKIYMTTPTGTWPYQISITARLNAFNGPVVASGFASVTLNPSTETEVNVQMQSGGFGNPPVDPGSTIAFVIGVNRQPGAPDPFYAVPGFAGGCTEVLQTSDTTPPLSTFRRNGVKIQITGNKFLKVGPGQPIQVAIDNADPGDTVTVAPGAYPEELTLRSDVDVIGAGPGDTILTPTTGTGVTATGITDTEFAGFTIRPAPGSTADTGILISGGSPFFHGNHVTGFPRNGVRIINGSTAFLCGNRLESNFDASNAFLDYNLIILQSKPLVTNNLIITGEAGCYIGFHQSDGMQFVNNTVADNSADGVWCYQSNPILKNNLVTGNTPGITASHSNATPVLTYNNVWGNQGFGNYNAQQTGVINVGTGSISLDPRYDGSAAGDYLLAASSPCIDAGDPAAIYNDLDGSRNDIGYTGGPCGSSTPPGAIVSGFVWTSVGVYANVEDIEQSGAKRGLTKDRDRPFGGSPWLYGAFGFTETAVYRYAVKIGKWTGNTPPAPAAFTYLDDPLSKVRYDISGGVLSTDRVALGPFDFAGRPTYVPTRNSGNIFWAHENLRIVPNTLGLENGVYSVRMEALNFLGTPVSFTVNQDIILHVNNTHPVASIDAVSYGGGAPFDECSIIHLPAETSTLNFVYTASHPDGFLDNYSLDALVGRNRSAGTIASGSYTPVPSAVWNGVALTPVAATPVSPEQPLPNLQLWESCAYQFRITAWARTTNGFGRIYWTSFFDNYAIDLNTPLVCSPDLDGDGDVDAEDLAIMAAAYGSAP